MTANPQSKGRSRSFSSVVAGSTHKRRLKSLEFALLLVRHRVDIYKLQLEKVQKTSICGTSREKL